MNFLTFHRGGGFFSPPTTPVFSPNHPSFLPNYPVFSPQPPRLFSPTTPSLLHKEGSTSLPDPLSSGERGKPLLLVALHRYALR